MAAWVDTMRIFSIHLTKLSVPRKAPLLPHKIVGPLSRFCFHTLLLSLFYSTIAVSTSPSSLGQYWFVLVSAPVVIGISFVTATLLARLMGLSQRFPRDFACLRIAACFPNIVALPILIFPSLCEYPVVYKGFVGRTDLEDGEMREMCENQANTMIFSYFFGWSLLFYGVGHHLLMKAAKLPSVVKDEDGSTTEANDDAETGESNPDPVESADEESSTGCLPRVLGVAVQLFSSPGLQAIILGFITACIPPLQEALFDSGGTLRFLGSAVQTLGTASSPMSTMIVAASLAPPPDTPSELETDESDGETHEQEESLEPPFMGDPNGQPRRSSIQRLRRSLRSASTRMWQTMQERKRNQASEKRKLRRLTIWFTLSRLLVTPIVVTATLVGLDCGGSGLLAGIPPMSKLVIIVNACLPGALVVVVLLKSRLTGSELSTSDDASAVVAQVYLPTYILSIFSIAAFTSVGLYVTLPDENGLLFCQR